MLELFALSLTLMVFNIIICRPVSTLFKNIAWGLALGTLVSGAYVANIIFLNSFELVMVGLVLLLGMRYQNLMGRLLFLVLVLFVLPHFTNSILFYATLGIACLLFSRNGTYGSEATLFSLYSFIMMLFGIIFPTLMVKYEFASFVVIGGILAFSITLKNNMRESIAPVLLLSVASSFYKREIGVGTELIISNWFMFFLIVMTSLHQILEKQTYSKVLSLIIVAMLMNSISSGDVLLVITFATIYLLCKSSFGGNEIKYTKVFFSLMLLIGLIKIPITTPLLLISAIIVMNYLSKEEKCLI